MSCVRMRFAMALYCALMAAPAGAAAGPATQPADGSATQPANAPASQPAKQARVIEQPERPDAMSRDMREAHQLKDQREDEKKAARFRKLLRRHADHYPVVQPRVVKPDGPWHYRRLTINAEGDGLDAFVFETPIDAPAYEMWWSFVVPDPHPPFQWYILPLDGRMEGFRHFSEMNNVEHDDERIADKNTTVYQRTPNKLPPGRAYLIWFAWPDEQARSIFVDVKLHAAPAADLEAPDDEAGNPFS